jgi:hypothetical protein
MRKSLLEALIVVAAASVLAVAMTFPLAFELGRVARIDTGDGQWSIWVVNWVARTLVADPLHVFDANIFYPHRGTLAYSETNLVTGALAALPYWLTKNPYFAHNAVLLLSFVLAAAGAYYLARYLTGSRPAAAVAGALFAFCPYVFAHTAHIHLMMTAGLPFSMLAFHRLADAPSPGRAAALGGALALTGLSCGYYGIYAALLVSLASVHYYVARRRWTDWRYVAAVAAAAVIAAALLFPALKQYGDLGESNRPVRELKDQFVYSATWSSYLASGGFGHAWLQNHIGEWREVLFPGFVALALAAVGLWTGLRGGLERGASGVRLSASARDDAAALRRTRPSLGEGAQPDETTQRGRTGGPVAETTSFYAVAGAFTFWLSFGPKAGLYSLVYETFPFFSLMRAPARVGLLAGLSVCVLAAVGVAHLTDGRRRGLAWASALALVALVEATPVPVRFPAVPPASPVYDTLAQLPPGAVLETPFFWRARDWSRHTYYMRMSTRHWKPLINGYSDYFPRDFIANAATLHGFPSREAFEVLRRYAPRYALIHLDLYDPHGRALILDGLERYRDYLRPLASDGDARLFEIVGWPDLPGGG